MNVKYNISPNLFVANGYDELFYKPIIKYGNQYDTTIKKDCYIGIDTLIANVKQSKMIEIECDDNFIFNGISSEKLIVIDSLGKENQFIFEELYNNGVLGQNIYHFEDIDGIDYNFVSKIQDMREIDYSCLIEIPNKLLIHEKRYVLSFEINNMVHKMNYIYDETNKYLKPL